MLGVPLPKLGCSMKQKPTYDLCHTCSSHGNMPESAILQKIFCLALQMALPTSPGLQRRHLASVSGSLVAPECQSPQQTLLHLIAEAAVGAATEARDDLASSRDCSSSSHRSSCFWSCLSFSARAPRRDLVQKRALFNPFGFCCLFDCKAARALLLSGSYLACRG